MDDCSGYELKTSRNFRIGPVYSVINSKKSTIAAERYCFCGISKEIFTNLTTFEKHIMLKKPELN